MIMSKPISSVSLMLGLVGTRHRRLERLGPRMHAIHAHVSPPVRLAAVSSEGNADTSDTNDPRPKTEAEPDSIGFDEAATVQADKPHPIGDGSAFERIGDYELLRELGHGGQGYVHLARDVRLNRLVAIKLLPPAMLVSDRARQRFVREAEAASRLADPGICTVYETGESEDGVPFIAMQYIDGSSLSTLLTDARAQAAVDGELKNLILPEPSQVTGQTGEYELGPRGLGPLLSAVESIARSLHVAHESGMVHRDVKPGNVMLNRDGRPVILDFGLAKLDDEADSGLTKTGDIMGTPAYMAPEQVSRADRRSDRRYDIYALGVTLYECLTLKRPFHGPTREALYRNILTREPTPPSRLNPRIDRDLEVVVLTAMEKDPDRRYHTALEFAEELRRVRQYEPIEARPAGTLLKLRRWAQRNPRVAALWAAIIVLLSTGLSISAWQNRRLDSANASLAQTNVELGSSNGKLAAANVALESTNQLLEDKRLEAERNAAEARANSERLGQALTRIKRLSDRRVLRRLEDRARKLWPATPERIPEFERWIADAESLLDRLPQHVAALAALRDEASPYTEDDRNRDYAEQLRRMTQLESVLEAMNEAADDLDGTELEEMEGKIEATENELEGLEKQVEKRGSWAFDSEDAAWVHELLEDLVQNLERFTTPGGIRDSVTSRLDFARTIRARSIEEHREAWDRAMARVRDGGERLLEAFDEQLGLVPLGPDPESGFEEFLHLESHEGPLPTRGRDGRLPCTESTGIVFILVPGGRFLMGSQSTDVEAENFFVNAEGNEGPVHEVMLTPYFIAKHEVTQAQWRTLTGRTPSFYGPGASFGDKQHSLRHPVEQVTQAAAETVLERAGLLLPTEAQWEFAARAGTSTPWWTGDEKETLEGAANLADSFCRRHKGPPNWRYEMWLDDGYSVHAPVDAHAANPFGLHGIHGNVWEWCRDAYLSYRDTVRPGDGLRLGKQTALRVARGGSYSRAAANARVSNRLRAPRTSRNIFVGVRATRSID